MKGTPWEGDRVPYEMCVVTPFFLLLIWNKEFHCMFAYCYCLDCILTFNCQSPISNLVCDVSFAVTFHPANWPRSTCHWENGLRNFTTCVIASLPSLFISVFLQHVHSFSSAFLGAFMAYPERMKEHKGVDEDKLICGYGHACIWWWWDTGKIIYVQQIWQQYKSANLTRKHPGLRLPYQH